MNFAVPSLPILQRESDRFKVDVIKPGIMDRGLHAFAEVNTVQDCTLAIDRKKIAFGYGKKLGEEDLCGFEDEPTLSERQAELEKLRASISSCFE